jgi:hypothetical protein
VTSVRYFRSLNLRAVAFTSSEGDAKQLADRFETFFELFHAAEISTNAQAPDPDVKALLDSLKIDQQKNRTMLTATVPLGFLRKALAEAPIAATPATTPEATPQSNAAKPQHK